MTARKEMQVSILLMGAEDHKNHSKAAHLSRKQVTNLHFAGGKKKRNKQKVILKQIYKTMRSRAFH